MTEDQRVQLANIANRQQFRNGPNVDTIALIAAILLEHDAMIETHSLNLLAINELEPDGGPDPLIAIATASTGTTISSRSAICSATAVDNSGTLDIRAVEEDRPRIIGKSLPQRVRDELEHATHTALEILDSLTTQPKRRDNFDEIVFREASRAGMGHERPSSISEPRDVRARMRDELRVICANWWQDDTQWPELIDRILDALRDPANLHESETFRFGEYSRRNIEAFIDDVRGRAI